MVGSTPLRDYLVQLPKYFFITGGTALSPISTLNAFDEALMKAGIAQCNLVPVSSILPSEAIEVKYVPLTPGAIVFTIMARIDGKEGDTLSAGVAWTKGINDEGVRYGLVVEAYGKKSREEIRDELKSKILRMAEVRKMSVSEIKFRIECINCVPENMYGSAIAAVIFVPVVDYPKVQPIHK